VNIRKGNAQRGIGKLIEEASTSQDPAHSARLEAFVQQGEAFAPQKCVSSHLHLEMLQCMQYQSTRMLTTPKRARQGRLEGSEKFGRNVLVVLILQIERESSPLSVVVLGAICFIRISTLLWLPVKKLWRSHVGFVGWVHKSEDQSFAHFVSASKKSWELFNRQGYLAILRGHSKGSL
jgi:hypothetical protein